ncbi:hypothetical protein LEP1GSC188_4071 [Leptospira weilii serovar Topaz str. LT2116]|uniref:Uncharacterized protein n=1 Tax=Leptospira weilii serovar Topaz str. LT2116 TaxID=1088540 RepID=M3H510_9LEPT|nr:hypothetical protein LEP1GSC188_4071 [Leptospira weilii serovar Topaz str. LT2116]
MYHSLTRMNSCTNLRELELEFYYAENSLEIKPGSDEIEPKIA